MELLFSNITGTVHQNNNLPCQDSYSVISNNERTVIAIADGHGGRVYCRSDLGAKFACEAALTAMRTEESDWALCIKREYDRKVKDHFLNNPLTNEEKELLGELSLETAYGSTLLVASIEETCINVFQLGDGEIHILGSDGCFLPQLPDDDDCVGSFTSSMSYSEEKAMQHFRVKKYLGKPAILFMYTDGYRNKYGRPYELAIAIVKKAEIDSILKEGEHGDDQTIVLAIDRSLFETESFIKGFDNTVAEFNEQVITVQKTLAVERIKNKICTIEDFLIIAQTKIEQCKKQGNEARLKQLEDLSEKKRQSLILLKEKLDRME